MNLYLLKSKNPHLAEFHYVIPIEDFNLQSNLDTTALHVAEHCCFGDLDQMNAWDKEGYRLGMYTPGATVSARSVFFHYRFDYRNFDQAYEYTKKLLHFISQPCSEKAFHYQRRDVYKEMRDDKSKTMLYGTPYRKIFADPPYSLTPVGLVSLFSKVTIDMVHRHQEVVAKSGGLFMLTWPEEQTIPASIAGIVRPFDEAPKRKPATVNVSSDRYASNQLYILVLPPMSEENLLGLENALDHLHNELDMVWSDSDVSIQGYPNLCLAIFYTEGKKDIRRTLKRAFRKLDDTLLDQIAKEGIRAVDSVTTNPHYVARNAIENWLNAVNLKEEADTKTQLQLIRERILSGK